jgi:predicted nucleic acid-binding protein
VSLVVDASVALKWVLGEPESERARALPGGEPLAAPDFLYLECANVLVQLARRGAMTSQDAADALEVISAAPVRRVPAGPHVHAAQRLALELGQTAYDSLYLAVALAEGAVLVTADDRFARAALARPAYARAVRRL